MKRKKRSPEEIAEDERKHLEVQQLLAERLALVEAKIARQDEARERERLRRGRRSQRLRRAFPFLPGPKSHA